MDVVDLHRRTVETWTEAVDAIRPDQWDGPTPCTEWSVRQLVNHVVGEDAWTVPLVRGSTIADVGTSLDGDLLGDHPIDTATDAAREALHVVGSAPGGGDVHLSYGDESLEEYLRQLAADHLVHAWDLAAAVRGNTHLDPELVAEVALWFADREEMYRNGGVIAARVETTDEDDPQAVLLAASGRDARWTPPTR